MRSANWSRAVLPENWQRAGFGIYVHWPFCAAKCPYCDFNSHVASVIDQDAWEQAYLAEIDRYGAEFPDRIISSVFFGGGTPSLMNPGVIGSILERVQKNWTLSNNVEITLEANPSSVETSKFHAYRSAGVNRVSIGVQALNDSDLRALGRLHNLTEALTAIETAASVFDRTSFDLIYGRQHQTLEAWQAELEQALTFGPSHLSLYQLTIEDGTAFGDRFRRGRLPGLPNEDLGADMYFATQEICESSGLNAYEVSNHAVPGQESLHNLIYWNSGDYIGVGPGAHGRLSIGKTRYATDTKLAPGAWLSDAIKGCGELSRTALSPQDRDQEFLLMGLRVSEGVDIDDLHTDCLDLEKIGEMQGLGLVAFDGRRLRATSQGRVLLNHILREITQT